MINQSSFVRNRLFYRIGGNFNPSAIRLVVIRWMQKVFNWFTDFMKNWRLYWQYELLDLIWNSLYLSGSGQFSLYCSIYTVKFICIGYQYWRYAVQYHVLTCHIPILSRMFLFFMFSKHIHSVKSSKRNSNDTLFWQIRYPEVKFLLESADLILN